MNPIYEALGYVFHDSSLLYNALTHSSYANENGLGASACNERLEFLGDAVLELTVSDLLYHQYKEMTEGELTKYRANLVCEPSLAGLARGLSLGKYLLLSRGEERTGGRERDSLLADALEAVFGAVYLDGGMEPARELIYRLFEPIGRDRQNDDPKTTLQEIIQKKSREPLIYAIVKESGPDHRKVFTANVSHLGRLLGSGKGYSKKEAEQNAAKAAIDNKKLF